MADSRYQQLMNDMRGDDAQSRVVVQSQQPSLNDQAAQGMFNARDDIRHKLVEEGWYGQQTTGNVDPDQGNVWGNGEGTEWNAGGSVWSNENNAGVWGHENAPEPTDGGIKAPEFQSADIDAPEIEEPDLER